MLTNRVSFYGFNLFEEMKNEREKYQKKEREEEKEKIFQRGRERERNTEKCWNLVSMFNPVSKKKLIKK